MGGSPATGGSVATGGASGANGGMATGGVNTGGSSPMGGGGAGGSPNGGVGGTSGGGNGGKAGSGGATGGSGGSAGGKASGLPVPPGPSDVPKPSGTPGNITVLDWAGFEAAVSWTYDDSLTSQTQNYAALQATGVRQTFYIVSGNNATSSVWTTAARDGHEIANHTAHHCHDNGTGCAWGAYAGSLAAELTQCTMHITSTFGVSGVYTMAAPFGDAGWATAAQSQFFINRGVAGGQIAPNDNTNPFSLPCKVVGMGETSSGFNTAIDMARSMGRWQIMLVHSLGGDGGYNPVMTTDVVSSINRTKGFGDVWQDSVVNIGAYWRAQKALSTVTPTTSGMDRTWTWTLPEHFPPGKYLRVRVDGGTLKQGGNALAWDGHGYYEIALDAGSVTLSP
jgi:peptidoglycan/xylan/chitin deacetylase (PgdA/CDA1 family)